MQPIIPSNDVLYPQLYQMGIRYAAYQPYRSDFYWIPGNGLNSNGLTGYSVTAPVSDSLPITTDDISSILLCSNQQVAQCSQPLALSVSK